MKNIAVITGAASGIGKEIYEQLKKEHKEIEQFWLIDINKTALKEMETNNTKTLCIDLTNIDEIELYKKYLEKETPNIKLLANCAGFGIFDHSENIELETKLNMIDLNIKSYVIMTDYSLPYMPKNSNIMNIASCAAFQPIPYINNYAATKSFVLSYSRALNQELKYKGIHVLAVTPFWTKTKFFNKATSTNKKEVVMKYSVMYESKDVVKKAIKDLYSKKDMSVYGKLNNFQLILTKILPHKLVMKIWMNDQKYDGTPNIR